MTNSSAASLPEPIPHKCPFCGTVRRYKQKSLFGGQYITWLTPDPCDCPGAVAHAEEIYQQDVAEEIRRQEERQKKERARLLKKSGLPARYHGATFGSAKVTDQSREAYEKAHKFTRGEMAGLLISGPVGTGKTHLAACIANDFLDRLKWVTFGGVIDLLGRIARSYSEAAQEEEWQILDELYSVPLLVLDDLGKEKVSEWVEQTLYRVVDSRYRENRPLVVTTNFTMETLEGRYPEVGPALVSRLVEMCEGVYLGGADWRREWLK